MPRTPQSRTITLASSAALSTGLGMIPLHRLPAAVRTAYVVLPAAAGAGAVVAALRRHPSRTEVAAPEATALEGTEPASGVTPRRVRRRVMRIALPIVVGGIIAGVGGASLAIDRGMEDGLRRRGVPAPRLMIGLASGALSLGLDVLSDRGAGEEPAGEGEGPTSPPSAR